MTVLLVIFILVCLSKFRNNEMTSEEFKKNIIFGIIVSIVIGVLETISPFFLAAGVGLIIYKMIKSKGKQNITKEDVTDFVNRTVEGVGDVANSFTSAVDEQKKKKNASQNFNYQENYRKKTKKSGISMREKKKILKNFNEKYHLTLTDEEQERILEASAISNFWDQEIASMKQKYESPYGWISKANSWLRCYLYVFNVQNVTSDVQMQYQICESAFTQVFDFVQAEGITGLDNMIRICNNKFLTNFNDITFTLSYRFMEARGKHYELKFQDVVSIDNDLDELRKKYDSQM